MQINIPGVEIKTQAEVASSRFSGLIWGQSGAGKTVFACSAPGNKVLINFDPDGPESLGPRDDVIVIDLSRESYTIVDAFKEEDPLVPYNGTRVRLSAFINNDSIGSVIVDSCSAYTQLAVEKGIKITNGATVERPSPGAYGARNALTLRMMTCILRMTGKYQKNVIFITHEDDGGVKNKEGELLHITMLIGGKLGSQAALQISEVWHLSDDGRSRKIMVRPGRMRKPMKTRMFDASKSMEFTLLYDQFGKDAPYGKHSLAEFIAQYEENGRNKIQVPK